MNWWKRLQARRSLEKDLEAELSFHKDMLAADGRAPALGNETQLREAIREQWMFLWLETTMRDIFYAWRGFRRNPGFSLTAIASLALGIGSVITVFTAADALLFRPLPYRQPDRLVIMWEKKIGEPAHERSTISPGNYFDWKSRSGVFEEIAAFEEFPTVLSDGDRNEQFRIQEVSTNFLSTLGVTPLLGRTFTDTENLASGGNDALLLISYRLWQNWFGGEKSVLGRRVLINSVPSMIIGVMAPEFYFRNREVDLWAPAGLNPSIAYRTTGGRYMNAVARLKDGIPLTQARARMSVLAGMLEKENPVYNKNWTVFLEPLRDSLVHNVRRSLLLLLAAVGLLLTVACSNVANLLLARHSSRRAELAVRAALGAGRARLMQQLFTESLLLAILGGAAGILLGRWALNGLVALAPRIIVETAAIQIDWRIIVFAVVLSGAAGIFFGLVPALVGSRAELAPELNRAGRGGGSAGGSLRGWLIAGQIAFSVILLAGAGLFLRSLIKLQNVDPGLNAVNLLTFRFNLPNARYEESARKAQLFAEAIDRIEGLPGVRSAAAVSHLPFNGNVPSTRVDIAGRPAARPGEGSSSTVRTVTPGYFRTMRIPFISGRDFTAADNTTDSPIRFIVNEAFVRKYLANEDPLESKISVAMDSTNPFGQIVGVVANVKEGSLENEATPTVYYVHAHLVYKRMTLLVSTNIAPLTLVEPARRIMHDLEPSVPIADVRTMETILADTYGRQRLSAMLLVVFSGSALLLAAIGIYGVVAYSVTERTHEIGVRLAMGAKPGRVVLMVLGNGARFVAAGLGLGLACALMASKYVSTLLFETGSTDPATFVFVPTLLLVVAIAAAWLPARRAARMDPMTALRVE
jgi:putative ABC transport system permease protein